MAADNNETFDQIVQKGRFLMDARTRLFAVFTLIASLMAVIPIAASAATAVCDGLTPTMVGTPGDDIIDGTSDDDIIQGRGGNDVINGKGGNDTLCGGGGDDTIRGGGGDDTILGQGGSDTLNGGGGADLLKGGTGDDVMRGAAGADTLRGNGDNDFLNGGDDSDTLFGGGGDDELIGRGGSDTQYGGTGNDTQHGGNGNDLMRGNKGADVLNGDGGDDDIRGGAGNDLLDGGNGVDVANGGLDTDTCLNSETLVNCEIDDQNSPPVAFDDIAEVDEDSSVLIDVLENDDDPDGDTLTPVVGDVPDGTAVVVDGMVSFTPDPDFSGETLFTYSADDGNGGISEPATVTVTVNPLPDAPVAEDDELWALEDDDFIEGSLFDDNGNGEDVDADGDELTVVEINGFAVVGSRVEGLGNGSIEVFANGDYIFTPSPTLDFMAAGATLTDFFTYVVEDETALTDDATVAVTVTGENDDPVAVDDPGDGVEPYETDEETSIVLSDLPDNDTDVDLVDTLFVAAVDAFSDEGAAVSLNEDGTVTYDPSGALDSIPDGESLIDDFSYTVGDGNGGTDTGLVQVIVNGLNDAPNVVDDEDEVSEDGPAIIIDVLDNDTDPDTGETATLDVTAIQVLSSIGQVTILPGDTIRYNPNGKFEELHDEETVTDVFGYTVEDVHGAAVNGTVTVTIQGVNQPWDAVDDEGIDVDEDGSVDIDVLDNDIEDEEGDSPTVTIVDGEGPANGSVLVTDNVVTYAPDPDYFGADSFDYQVDDGFGGLATATVSITVNPINDPPLAQDDAFSTIEDTPITGENVLADNGNGADSDVEGETMTVVEANGVPFEESTVITLTVGEDTLGDVTLGDDGSLSFEPALDASGEASFTYATSDGIDESESATVTITVVANAAPVANADTAEVDEDSSVDIDVLENDDDAEEDPLTIDSYTQGANGAVSENEDGTLKYVPEPDFSGEDSFTYVADDGTDLSESATVTVTVNPLPDAPVAVDDSGEGYRMPTGVPSFITGDVLDNDFDVDDDFIDVDNVDVSGTLGTVTYNEDGTFTYENTGGLTDGDTDSWDYTITDGALTSTATVTIVINSVPDAVDDPSGATAECCATDEDTVLNGGEDFPEVFVVIVNSLLDNDTDADDDALTLTEVNGDAGNVGVEITLASGALLTVEADGTFVYDPNGQFEALDDGEFNTDSFTYTADDGFLGTDTATVTITINGVNDAPVADDDAASVDEDESVDVDVVLNDDDVELEDLSVFSYTQGANGVVTENVDGTLKYTPNANFNGEDEFTYVATDGTANSESATVTITVNSVPDAPIAQDDSFVAFLSVNVTDENLFADNGSGIDDDGDGDSLAIVVADGVTVFPAEITLTNGTATVGSDGSFSFVPSVEGTDSFSYRVSDGALTDTATVTISVFEQMLLGTTGDGNSPGSVLVQIDPATGATMRTIGAVGYIVNGMEYDPSTGTLYASTSVKDATYNGLITIDVSTGAGTPVGVLGWGLDTTAAVTNITIDASGQMYGWWDPSQDDLVSIDSSTGIATRVGESNVGTGRNALDFDASGVLYMVNGGGPVYTVNPLTGAASSVGSVGTDAHHGDFDPSTDLFYGIGNGSLVVIDMATFTVDSSLPGLDDTVHVITWVGAPVA